MTIDAVNTIRTQENLSEADLKDRKLRQSCSDFEAMFINYMMQAMKKTLSDDGLLDGGPQQDMYESMCDQQMAVEAAKGKGMGIGEALYRQLKQFSG